MKKIAGLTLLMAAMVSISHSVLSQTRIGFKAGGNVTYVSFQTVQFYPSRHPQIGFHGGLVSQIPLNERWFLQPELIYSLKGWSYAQLVADGRMQMHYLDLPLLVGLQPSKRLTFFAGPQVGYLLKSDAWLDADRSEFTFVFHRLDVSLVAGAAVKLSSGLGIDIRYGHGLVPVGKTQSTIDFTNLPFAPFPGLEVRDGRHRVFQLGLFYILPGKR